jgi:hypothetical protein
MESNLRSENLRCTPIYAGRASTIGGVRCGKIDRRKSRHKRVMSTVKLTGPPDTGSSTISRARVLAHSERKAGSEELSSSRSTPNSSRLGPSPPYWKLVLSLHRSLDCGGTVPIICVNDYLWAKRLQPQANLSQAWCRYVIRHLFDLYCLKEIANYLIMICT